MIHDKCTKPAGGLAGSLSDVFTKSCLQALPCKDNVHSGRAQYLFTCEHDVITNKQGNVLHALPSTITRFAALTIKVFLPLMLLK